MCQNQRPFYFTNITAVIWSINIIIPVSIALRMRFFFVCSPMGTILVLQKNKCIQITAQVPKDTKGSKISRQLNQYELFCIFSELFDLFLYLFIFHSICVVTANVVCSKVLDLKIRIIVLFCEFCNRTLSKPIRWPKTIKYS